MKNKVIEFVIEPLTDWFDKDITDGQIKVYGEVLGKYAPETLEKAMRDLKATWTSKFIPLPANIRELCDYHVPKTKPLTLMERANLNFWDAAARIIPTPIGKQALKECWGRSLVCEVMISGKMNYTDIEIEKFREGRKQAENTAKSINPKNAEERLLLDLWHTMQNREQELLDKYKHLIVW